VANGETLSHIALRYGVRVADIQAANPRVRPRALRIGTLLTVPVAPSARTTIRGS
jgi:LysM repeat protein